MSSLKIINGLKRQKTKLLLLLLYIPVFCSLIGFLAYYMKSPTIVIGRDSFIDRFWFYANPLNGNFIVVHLPALVLSLAFLLLMVMSASSSKPIITIYPIRIILLVLISLITILVVVFNVITPLLFQARNYYMHLFLFVDVHLILVFLLTFLPLFRKLKTKLV